MPPELEIKIKEVSDLTNNFKDFKDVQLPIDILLLTVKDIEFQSCYFYLKDVFQSYEIDLGYVYFGEMGEVGDAKLKVALIKCSANPGGALLVVKNTVMKLQPKAVFCVGYCGALHRETTKLGDVIVSAKLTTFVERVETNQGVHSRGFSVPVSNHISKIIQYAGVGWNAPLKNPEERGSVKVHSDGEFLSGRVEIDSEERRRELVKLYPNAIAIEKDGEGVFSAAQDLRMEWVVIKGISNYVDGTASFTKEWEPFASAMAASVVNKILRVPAVFEKWPHYQSSDSGRAQNEGQPHQPHNQISCGAMTYQGSFHVNKPMDPHCPKCQASFCPRCGKTAHEQLGKVVQGNTDHSKSTTRGEGLVEAEQGAEASFTITTRDSRGPLFYDERERVTVSVGRHNVEIMVNRRLLTGSPWKVEVKPHQYKVVGSSGSGELSGPYCIAKNEVTGDIAVADYFKKRVQVFNKNMKHLKTITGGEADTQRWVKIGCPVSVAFLKNNNIIVTHEQYSSHDKKLSVITRDDLFIEHFSEHLIKAHHVFVKNDDGHVIVCDKGDRRIKEISSDGKELLLAFSAPDSKVSPSFPYYYHDMFFVSYMRAHSVKVFDKEGKFLYNIGIDGSGEVQLRYPEGLSVDSHGNLIVCDASDIGQNLHDGVLKMFTLRGTFLTSFGEDTLKVPWIVSSCNNGDLLVADLVGDSVHILR